MESTVICPTCAGLGWYDIGDCEDGVTETCGTCDGAGEVEEEA